jgi:hypothetical protein
VISWQPGFKPLLSNATCAHYVEVRAKAREAAAAKEIETWREAMVKTSSDEVARESAAWRCLVDEKDEAYRAMVEEKDAEIDALNQLAVGLHSLPGGVRLLTWNVPAFIN